MDEDTIDAIRREIHPPGKNVLIAQSHDPLVALPPNVLKRFQWQRRNAVLAKIAVGIGTPICIYVIDDILFPGTQERSYSTPKSGAGEFILTFFIPFLIICGLYELVTISQKIASQQRRRLL
jgi:hypothetical protein